MLQKDLRISQRLQNKKPNTPERTSSMVVTLDAFVEFRTCSSDSPLGKAMLATPQSWRDRVMETGRGSQAEMTMGSPEKFLWESTS